MTVLDLAPLDWIMRLCEENGLAGEKALQKIKPVWDEVIGDNYMDFRLRHPELEEELPKRLARLKRILSKEENERTN